MHPIKSFFGISENAVKSQIWIAVSVYVLVAIIKKRLDLPVSLYTILQTLSLTADQQPPEVALAVDDGLVCRQLVVRAVRHHDDPGKRQDDGAVAGHRSALGSARRTSGR